MDPDWYRQEVADSFAEAAHWVAVLRRVLVAALVAAAALLLLLWSGRVLDLLALLVRPLGVPWHRLAPSRALPQPVAVVAAGFTLAAGVLAAALNLDGGGWRQRRRFWQQTPAEIRAALTEPPKDTWVGHYDHSGYDRAVTRATYHDRKQSRRQPKPRR